MPSQKASCASTIISKPHYCPLSVARSCRASHQVRGGLPPPSVSRCCPVHAPPTSQTSSGPGSFYEAIKHSELAAFLLWVLTIHSSTYTFVLHSFTPAKTHSTTTLCPLKGKSLWSPQTHQWLWHLFFFINVSILWGSNIWRPQIYHLGILIFLN